MTTDNITISRAVVEQALGALNSERVMTCDGDGNYTVEATPKRILKAITNLTAALEAAEKQEPVAWMGEYNINDIRDHYTVVMRHKTDFSSMPDRVRPLYTHPQPAIPDGWQAVVSEFIAAWDGSADPKAVGSTCRFIRAESALRDLIAPKQE